MAQLSPECSVNHLRVESERDLGGELKEWLRRVTSEAVHKVGPQECPDNYLT